MLSSGQGHTCYLHPNQQIRCWGENLSGQLGYGDIINRGDKPNTVGLFLRFVDLGKNVKLSKIRCGGEHSCAVTIDSELKCWGQNLSGQIGIGSSAQAIGDEKYEMGERLPFVNLGMKVSDVALGLAHTCTLLINGKVKCFGEGSSGRLGYENVENIGNDMNKMGQNLPFVDLGSNYQVKSLHSSGMAEHTCVILANDRAKCFGYGDGFRLGYESDANVGDERDSMGDSLPEISFGVESRVKILAVGATHTCALRFDDALRCWGVGNDGRLGMKVDDALPLMEDESFTYPVPFSSIKPAIISASSHTCIIFDDSTSLRCLGTNNYGELGNNTTSFSKKNGVNLFDITSNINLGLNGLKVTYLQTGYHFTCVLLSDFSVKCFGSGENGKLGLGSSNNIGLGANDMGSNLPFVDILSTISPTKTPSKSPTLPTKPPSRSPSKIPTTKAPTKRSTNAPISAKTSSPTKSPLRKQKSTSPQQAIDVFIQQNNDCSIKISKNECIATTDSNCGSCNYIQNSSLFNIKLKIGYMMDNNTYFTDFDNYDASSPKKTFITALKALISLNINQSIQKMLRIDLNTAQDLNSGYATYQIYFSTPGAKESIYSFLASIKSKSSIIEELNQSLNIASNTQGKRYLPEKIWIADIINSDVTSATDYCDCPDSVKSEAPNSSLNRFGIIGEFFFMLLIGSHLFNI